MHIFCLRLFAIGNRNFILVLLFIQSSLCFATLESQFPVDCTKLLEMPSLDQKRLSSETAKVIIEYIGQQLREQKTLPLRFAIPTASFAKDSDTIDLLKDKNFSSLYLLEPLDKIRRVPHELKTANDFSKFLAPRGQALLFVGDFQGKSVPMFDGIIIDTNTGVPIANVSLKSSQSPVSKFKLENLLASMKARLSLDYEFKHYMTGPGWFLATTQNAPVAKTLRSPLLQSWFRHASILANLFAVPLTDETPNTNYRELRTVVDMRKSGYTVAVFKDKQVLKAIQEIVDQHKDRNLSLTLLWDADYVIEFTRGGTLTYGFNL